jgi:NADP-dependent 3-hydroxy acid dehydrogenase YdfG
MSPLASDDVVVVTGAAGPAGQAVVRRLVAGGASVVGVDTDDRRLAEVREGLGRLRDRFTASVVDLVEEEATRAFARRLVGTGGSGGTGGTGGTGGGTRPGRVDGVVHLVGGYRGGSRFADNTTEDWLFLHSLLIRTVQNVSLAFHDALVASARGRFVLVSATAASSPSAGSAGYAAAKAAAEAWTMALADSFRHEQSGRKPDPRPQQAAATVLVVKALVHDGLRAASPDAAFDGYTDVADLADVVAGLWDTDAALVNGARRVLAP